MRLFLTLTGVFEAATGIAFAAVPDLATELLAGVLLVEPAALVVARLAGLALIALGGACWLARNDRGSVAGRALLMAMMFYNVTVIVLLVYAALGPGLVGILLWPAVVAHVALGVWCGRELAVTRVA
jgi:hypothetical protein